MSIIKCKKSVNTNYNLLVTNSTNNGHSKNMKLQQGMIEHAMSLVLGSRDAFLRPIYFRVVVVSLTG